MKEIGRPLRPWEQDLISPVAQSVDLISFVIITLVAFYIFYKLNTISKVSPTNSISYLRTAFLFFGIAYLTRIVILLLPMREFPLLFVGISSMIIFPFFSLLGISYLIASLYADKIKNEWVMYVLPIVLLVLSVVVRGRVLTGFLIIFSIVIFGGFLLALIMKMRMSKKKKLSLYLIYFLLALAWLISVLSIPLVFLLDIDRYAISIFITVVFLVILRKVINIFKL